MLLKRTIFLPKMSDRRPYIGWHAVEVSRYDVPTQDEMEASLKTRPSVGSAVETLVKSV
jgi:hypothetical protein